MFKHHSAPITSVEWHPTDSTVFASAGADNQVGPKWHDMNTHLKVYTQGSIYLGGGGGGGEDSPQLL